MNRFCVRAAAFLAGVGIAAGMEAAHALPADPARPIAVSGLVQPGAPMADIAARPGQ